jgi:hypothetical protein
MAVFLCLLIHASASGCFHRGRAGDSPRCVREDWQAAECWPQLFDLDPAGELAADLSTALCVLAVLAPRTRTRTWARAPPRDMGLSIIGRSIQLQAVGNPGPAG